MAPHLVRLGIKQPTWSNEASRVVSIQKRMQAVDHAFLQQVMVKDALMTEGAKAKRLEDAAPVREHIDEALRKARLVSLKSEIQVTDQDVVAFYADNLPRLSQVKSKWDPGNLFQFAQSIPPAKQPARPDPRLAVIR